MDIKKIYDMIYEYDDPEIIGDEIRFDNIRLWINAAGSLIIQQWDGNKCTEVVIPLGYYHDKEAILGMELMRTLIKDFNWEV